jgi:hypothetical protein
VTRISTYRIAQTIRAKWLGVAALALVMSIFGVWSLSRGQDVNFDQRNYHMYGVWALFHDRFAVDFAPAGLGTFLPPYHNIPFFYMALNAPPRFTGFVMGATQGVAAWLVVVIAWRLLPQMPTVVRACLSLLAMIVGSWAPGVIATIGTSFGDITTAIPILAAVAVLVRPSGANATTRALVLAGALVGVAAALKPTQGVYVVALLLVLLALVPFGRVRLRAFVACGSAAAATFSLCSVSWMWMLWTRYESPVFPSFNNLFRSPYYPPTATADSRWRARGLADMIDTPIEFVTARMRFGEIALRDGRWLIIVLLLLFLLVARRSLRAWLRVAPFGEVLVVLFCAAGFGLWTVVWTYHRYLVPLEFLSGVVVLLLVRRLVRDREQFVAIYALTTAAVIVSVVGPDHGHLPWGSRWYDTRLPPIALRPSAMVVMATSEPISYVIPSFPPSVRFVRVYSQGFLEGAETAYTTKMRAAIDAHRGELLFMGYERDIPIDEQRLVPYGVALDGSPCEMIRNRLESDLVVCRLRRS